MARVLSSSNIFAVSSLYVKLFIRSMEEEKLLRIDIETPFHYGPTGRIVDDSQVVQRRASGTPMAISQKRTSGPQ
jgi:hypothetical protein